MNANEFKQAFLETWEKWTDSEERVQRVIDAWEPNRSCRGRAWTKFMLGNTQDTRADSFLYAVGARLGRSVNWEQYTLDCVFCRDEPDLLRRDGGYPAGYDAIIENENDGCPEEEWWKLLIFRAPLKILIFYDWSDEEKENIPDRANWLVDRLENFAEMTRQMRYRWPGRRDEDDYLIVVGYVAAGEDLPRWRWL